MISKQQAEKYCTNYEEIENYEAALNSEELWHCHHRLETELNKTRQQLIEENMYFDRPASELIFLTASEHERLHKTGKVNGENNPMYGKTHSEETRKKMSAKQKGENNPMYGKENKWGHHSEETKMKMSAAQKGKHWSLSDDAKKKISEAHKGKVFTDETRKKLSEAKKGKVSNVKGKHWHLENGKRVYTAA